MDPKTDKAVRHIIQTILKQIVDINNHVASSMKNEQLSEADKNATTNFSNYHLLVLSILLHEVVDKAKEIFPDAMNIIEWAEKMYQDGLNNKNFTECKCLDCIPAVNVEVVDQQEKLEA